MRYSHINYNGRTASHAAHAPHPCNFNAKEIMPKKRLITATCFVHKTACFVGRKFIIIHKVVVTAALLSYTYYGWSLPLTFPIGETGGSSCFPERFINYFFSIATNTLNHTHWLSLIYFPLIFIVIMVELSMRSQIRFFRSLTGVTEQ